MCSDEESDEGLNNSKVFQKRFVSHSCFLSVKCTTKVSSLNFHVSYPPDPHHQQQMLMLFIMIFAMVDLK